MKTILTHALVLLAFAFAVVPQAQAVPYYLTLNTAAYSGDTSGGTALSSYSAYYMSTDAAEDYFGGSDVQSIQDYYLDAYSTDVPENATAFGEADFYADQYTFDKYVGTAYASDAYVAVVFYAEEKVLRIFSEGSASLLNGSLIFDDESAASGTVSDWMTVPEPTSALLILLGLAGLALKRTRTQA